MTKQFTNNKDLLAQFEKSVDDKLLKIELPSKNSNLAKWIFLTVADDLIFLNSTERVNPNLISIMADSYKYALKALLSKINKELKDAKHAKLPKYIGKISYERSVSALHSAIDYSRGEHICFGTHVGYFRLEGDTSVLYAKSEKYWNSVPYSFLELFEVEEPMQMTLLTLIVSYANNPADFPDHLLLQEHAFIDKNNFVNTTFSNKILSQFERNHPSPPSIIPVNWKFPWGDSKDAEKVLWTLTLRCCMHLMAVRSGAMKFKVEGGGLESLIYVTDRNQLINELSTYTGLKRDKVDIFIKHVVYGYKTKNPDIALQPLIPLNDGSLVAISAISLLSSRQDRNLLSLHSRVDRKSFDNQSAIFEVIMTDEIETCISETEFKSIRNRHVPNERGAGDLDLCIIDETNSTIMICELRWMLQPGDPQEIVHRTQSCIEKIEKIQKKVNAAKNQKKLFVRDVAGRFDNFEEWQINGIIIIDGYGGIESTAKDYPIMPKEIFLQTITRFENLKRFHKWAKELSWLPKEGVHFTQEDQVRVYEDITIHSPGFSLTTNAPRYRQFIIESAERNSNID